MVGDLADLMRFSEVPFFEREVNQTGSGEKFRGGIAEKGKNLGSCYEHHLWRRDGLDFPFSRCFEFERFHVMDFGIDGLYPQTRVRLS